MKQDDGGGSLAGVRVLVVEDLYLIANEIEADVRRLGGTVVGPARNLSAARRIMSSQSVDLAVLDVNLEGDMVFPLARDLVEAGKPFLFLTGYGDWAMPAEWRDLPRLCKPVRGEDLCEALLKLRAQGAPHAA
jgi:DNA-binding LytR/AlgR family response regulator